MDFSGIILFFKILGFVASLAFAVGIVISWLGKKEIGEQVAAKKSAHFNPYSKKENPLEKRWAGIRSHFQSQNPAEWRMAIIDADAMLEDLVTQKGYIGATFGEKLKSINSAQFPYLNDAWHVHKLRNVLAHEGTAYHLSDREAYEAFKTYENIFYGTGYLS